MDVMRFRRNFLVIGLLFAMLMTLFCCNHWNSESKTDKIEVGYDSIATANHTVNHLMLEFGKAYREKEITEKQKEKIDRNYKEYRELSMEAVEALIRYKKAENKDTKSYYLAVLRQLHDSKRGIISLAKKLLDVNIEEATNGGN